MKGNVLVCSVTEGLINTYPEDEFDQTEKVNMVAEPAKSEKREFFVKLLNPVKFQLYNYILKSLNFSVQGDDLYQDVLLKAFRYFETYDRSRKFKTWIFTIAHNLIKDYFKRPDFNNHTDGEKDIGFDDSNVQQQVREIYHVAGGLKPRQREVFFLYYDYEFKTAEISRITGLSRTNVKYILNQARMAIKKILEIGDERNG